MRLRYGNAMRLSLKRSSDIFESDQFVQGPKVSCVTKVQQRFERHRGHGTTL